MKSNGTAMQKRRPGRPSKLTPQVVAMILTAIRCGASNRIACEGAGICPETLCAWKRRGTAIPSGTGNFTSFGSNSFPSIDGGNVAFFGAGSSGQQGLYLSAGGMLQEIISLNDTLDGKTLLTLGIFTRGLSGTSIAFFASFTDGSNGIYRADADSPVPIAIDIKPGSFPNSINQGSGGVIPVAILGSATFDATTVDPFIVEFGPSGAFEAHDRGHIKDVDSDGGLDLMLHFAVQDTGISCGDTGVSLIGETFDGQLIGGSDSIRTVGCK